MLRISPNIEKVLREKTQKEVERWYRELTPPKQEEVGKGILETLPDDVLDEKLKKNLKHLKEIMEKVKKENEKDGTMSPGERGTGAEDRA